MSTGRGYDPVRLAFDNRDWDALERLMRDLQADKARLDHLEEERQRAKRLGWPCSAFHPSTADDTTVRQQLDVHRGVA